MNYPLVSVIIPTYNREESLIRTLKSLANSMYKNLEIIIVNMGSSSNERLKRLINAHVKFDKNAIKILRGHEQMFISGAINKGIKYAKGQYILICADDVVVNPDTIEVLVRLLLNNKDFGIICPICYYLRDPKRIWWAGTKYNMWTSRTYFYGRTLPLPTAKVFDTDSFTTIALIRRELFISKDGKLFFVDPREFPIHYEEADFSFRARAKGWRVCVTRDASAYHDIPPPTRKSDLARLFHVHTENRAYYVARNRIIFQKKYSKPWQFLVFLMIFNWLFMLYYLRIILLKSKKPFNERLKIAKSYLKGIIDGVKWALSLK
ncbi:MAG: glycosyltransferase family 2 protein [Thermoprotei archaeon]|nr:MAG: glycosyltransferase family 2 protein [Thermoprotei archaeon]